MEDWNGWMDGWDASMEISFGVTPTPKVRRARGAAAV